MAVPTFQQLMLPLLRLVEDGREHELRAIVASLADVFKLSEADRTDLLSSGRQTRFANRVGWARSHLRAAGLLENVGRGTFRITASGAEVLATNPDEITMKALDRFPGYKEFRVGRRGSGRTPAPLTVETDQTPEEALEANYIMVRETLVDELLNRVKSSTPAFFEQLVVELLVAMGYGGSLAEAGRAVGQSGDEGVDGLINQDKLGLDTVYLQAKRWEHTVGRPVAQAFAGSLEGLGASKGVLLTTSGFSAEAREYVTKIQKRIILVDGRQLAELMIDHNVGVTAVNRYDVKRVDEDFFEVGIEETATSGSDQDVLIEDDSR